MRNSMSFPISFLSEEQHESFPASRVSSVEVGSTEFVSSFEP